MKWKNLACGTGTFFITASIAGHRPLLQHEAARQLVLADFDFYRKKYECRIPAYVIMPEHYHVVVDLNEPADLRGWLRDVQSHSGKVLRDWLKAGVSGISSGDGPIWKEQARAFGILTENALRTKINYLHANPVRRGLVAEPGEWEWSSWRSYYLDDDAGFHVDRIDAFL